MLTLLVVATSEHLLEELELGLRKGGQEEEGPEGFNPGWSHRVEGREKFIYNWRNQLYSCYFLFGIWH